MSLMVNGHIVQSHDAISTLASEESEVLPSETPEISKVAAALKNVHSGSLPHDPVVENSLPSVQHKGESHSSPRSKVNGKGKMDDNIVAPAPGDSKSAHTTTNSSHSVSYFSI